MKSPLAEAIEFIAALCLATGQFKSLRGESWEFCYRGFWINGDKFGCNFYLITRTFEVYIRVSIESLDAQIQVSIR